MAILIPDYTSNEVKSSAERKIFKLISDANELDDYFCLHSLALARHQRKRMGELDFVLINNRNIICLEIKGGQVKRENGVWIFKNRFGEINTNSQGPFRQVSDSMFSLCNDLKVKFGSEINNLLFGFGVVFPDVVFDKESVEWDSNIIYDLNDSNVKFSTYIKRLVSYWESKLPAKSGLNDVKHLINYMRGDFEVPIPLWKKIKDTEDEIKYFTNEQYTALDHMSRNNKVIFHGAAGTGKTLLAVEKSRRNYFSNKKTLLLCFNKLLGYKLKKEINEIDKTGDCIVANSIHKYFYEIIQKGELSDELRRISKGESEKTIYHKYYPYLFKAAMEKIDDEKFDCIIIDEAQDILSKEYLSALEMVFENGFENGNWYIFMDSERQGIYNRFDEAVYSKLLEYKPVHYDLLCNCRNTREVITQTSIISEFFVKDDVKVSGNKVYFHWYSNMIEQANELCELLNNLVYEEKIPLSYITLLSPSNACISELSNKKVSLPCQIQELDQNNINDDELLLIKYTSAQSYKGLENKIIIFNDIENFSEEWEKSVMYVGMTRSKAILHIFINEKLKKSYDDKVRRYISLLKSNNYERIC